MEEYVAIGIDAQPRGLAISMFELESQDFISATWWPIESGLRLEEAASAIYGEVTYALAKLAYDKYISLITVEFPTAKASSQFVPLWTICGATLAGAGSCITLDGMVEGIYPVSWKKYSGLNDWAKGHNIDKKGVVQKQHIPAGITWLLKVPTNLNPPDLYDAIAIGKAGLVRNLERVT